jgi:Family of unknown function (DUF6527)
MQYHTLEHRFVRNVPRDLEPGVLYISMEYATAVHSCCCGCGERVVTPLTPTDWYMTFDGESISLHPSVGNWNQKCRSHYVIQHSRVLEAGAWTNAQVEAECLRDKKAKAAYYGSLNEAPGSEYGHSSTPKMQGKAKPALSIWSRLKSLFTS